MKTRIAWLAAAVLAAACGGSGEGGEDGSASTAGTPEAAVTADQGAAEPAAAGSWSSAEQALDRQAELWNELADILAEVHDVAGAERAAPRITPIADEIDATNRYLEGHPLSAGPTAERSQRLLDGQQRYASEMARISREDVRAIPILADRAPGN